MIMKVRRIFSATQFTAATIILFAAFGATAETTNDLSGAEIQGRNLARQISEQQPAENFTNTGVLKIRDGKGDTSEVPIKFETLVTTTNWLSVYDAEFSLGEDLRVVHVGNETNEYRFHSPNGKNTSLSGNETMIPFANSDFWLCDLGLEFFHWPEQKILKHEIKRSRACTVLESTNPNPSTNGYSRVISWIDNETLGIVMAYAYDAQDKKLKEFYPKDFKKVNGAWQVGMMEMDNVQTGSRSRMEFDLKE